MAKSAPKQDSSVKKKKAQAAPSNQQSMTVKAKSPKQQLDSGDASSPKLFNITGFDKKNSAGMV
ncbi:MAG: hypothetical protein UZ06_CHB003001040 [Chlorobi bacterium OLB6]|nr:MAG: hypothetical protein UZ06_CHB003001040 [Chlorobi bacterium OLB6]